MHDVITSGASAPLAGARRRARQFGRLPFGAPLRIRLKPHPGHSCDAGNGSNRP